jgi:hypothetical protein
MRTALARHETCRPGELVDDHERRARVDGKRIPPFDNTRPTATMAAAMMMAATREVLLLI